MGVMLMSELGRISTMTAPPKKKWMKNYMQGESPKEYVHFEHGEDASDTDSKRSSDYVHRRQPESSSSSSVNFSNGYCSNNGSNNNGGGAADSRKTTTSNSNGASVIQRLATTTPNYADGSRAVSALYSYNEERVRSPSPARGGYCNGRSKDSQSPPPHLFSGNIIAPQRSYSSSSSSIKLLESVEQHQYDSVTSSSYRVDDLASRSHRLEEALLRASRRSSPTIQASSQLSSNLLRSSGQAAAQAADELHELKKRSGAGTREVHNKLEKNRRAHLRECFEFLRKQLPAIDDKKLSNLGILKSALRYIQTLKRKEREYEHAMERLAREKIAAQQRLTALRKEVSSIPEYGSDAAALLDLDNVLPVLHGQHLNVDRECSLTYANIQNHNMRDKVMYNNNNNNNNSGANNKSSFSHHEDDKESNSTSTASERGDISDDGEEKSFQETYLNCQDYRHQDQRHAAADEPSPPAVDLTRAAATTATKRSYPADDDSSSMRDDHSRPHIKYIRTAATGGQTAYLQVTSPVVELAAGSNIGTLESKDGERSSLFVRQPIAFATTASANGLSAHVQLSPQVLSAHSGVQLFGSQLSSLKVLAPSSMAGVRVISADGASSLQPLVAVHPTSSVSGVKTSDESTVLNGTATTSFCIPAGVVIPNLVAFPPESSSTALANNYELTRNSSQVNHSANMQSNSPVLSLPNGLLKSSVNRSLQPTSTTGVTHVMTPISVARSVPLVTSVAVMQQAKHVTHILANPSLDKVVAGPLLKTGSIPIIGRQYLASSALAARHVIKPVVVVAAPQSSSSPTNNVSAPREVNLIRTPSPKSQQQQQQPIFKEM